MNALPARLIAVLAVASGAAVLAGPAPLAIAGGLLLAFLLPGLALLRVFFRGRDLTAVERMVLAPALSMGVLIAAGLVTYVVRLRIDRVSWTVATASVTLAALIAAQLMRRVPAAPEPRPVGEQQVRREVGEQTVRLPVHGMAEAATVVMSIVPVLDDEQETADQYQAQRRRLARQLLPLLLVVAVLGGASWLSFSTSRSTHNTTVTALSAAPSGPVDADGNRQVQVSASGLLAVEGPYRLTVTGTTKVAAVERTIAVTGAGTWAESLALPGAQRLTVNLYRWGDTTAYRTLFISAVE